MDHSNYPVQSAATGQKLWSLWDMIYQFQAGYMGAALTNLEGEISCIVLRKAFSDYEWERHRAEILRQMRTLRTSLQYTSLSPFLEGIWDRADQRISSMGPDQIDVAAELLVQLKQGLLTYLKQPLFLMVENKNVDLYFAAEPFGDAVETAFPLAVHDIREAAQCLAVERYTAAVFHLMRALEHGRRWCARDLGRTMSPNLDEQWKTLIDWMLSEISKQEGQPNTPEKAERLQFYSSVAFDLRNFKNAWRNDVSHARVTYEEPEASKVWAHVKSFMEALAARIAS